MKITIEDKKIICQNRYSRHNYFAWPSVAKLPDGGLAMTCSGFRLAHICPFGKVVMCRSFDEGKTWSVPGVVLDTTLDDRDAGIVPFGKDNTDVILTSFNDEFQENREHNPDDAYIQAYCDKMEPMGQKEKYHGSVFLISHDGGITWGDLKTIPVSSPHGPLATPDGKLLYVGMKFFDRKDGNSVHVYTIDRDGNYEKLSEIENAPLEEDLFFCEPHAVLLKNGKIICHIRAQNYGENKAFTLYQTESCDMGKTWTKPHPIISRLGGAPAHLLELSDGTLISAYCCREEPVGLRLAVSHDSGETWEADIPMPLEYDNPDMGYPCSVELSDGRILTVFYTHTGERTPAVIMQMIWRIEK